MPGGSFDAPKDTLVDEFAGQFGQITRYSLEVDFKFFADLGGDGAKCSSSVNVTQKRLRGCVAGVKLAVAYAQDHGTLTGWLIADRRVYFENRIWLQR